MLPLLAPHPEWLVCLQASEQRAVEYFTLLIPGSVGSLQRNRRLQDVVVLPSAGQSRIIDSRRAARFRMVHIVHSNRDHCLDIFGNRSMAFRRTASRTNRSPSCGPILSAQMAGDQSRKVEIFGRSDDIVHAEQLWRWCSAAVTSEGTRRSNFVESGLMLSNRQQGHYIERPIRVRHRAAEFWNFVTV
jgi:hypothetical protein